jgi:hypothetical protein
MTNDMNNNKINSSNIEPGDAHPVITQEALAQLGDGEIAYVRAIRSEDVASMFPQAPQVEPGVQLFSLHAADGTPIMLTDSREAAVANAWSQELETVSVH